MKRVNPVCHTVRRAMSYCSSHHARASILPDDMSTVHKACRQEQKSSQQDAHGQQKEHVVQDR